MPALPAAEIERVFRDEYGRAVAVLISAFGDIDLAEEAVQDAFAAAVRRWPASGLPPSPARRRRSGRPHDREQRVLHGGAVGQLAIEALERR